MHEYPEAYTEDNLVDIMEANEHCPNISYEEIERLLELVKRRADARGEDSALDETQTDCIIATEWDGFAADEFGFDNGTMNQFAIGVLEERVSAGKGATLFSDTVVVQNGWLTTGDGRKKQMEDYVDDEYDNANAGEFWIPNGAQDYICIVAISDELVHGEITLADAM